MSNFAEHRQGCPALPGYGHAPEPCTCGAMTAETDLLPLPEPFAWVDPDEAEDFIDGVDHRFTALRRGVPDGDFPIYSAAQVRACVSSATAPLQAEIEALRAEVEAVKESLSTDLRAMRAERERAMEARQLISDDLATAEARADKLAEALRLIESAKDRGFGIDYARGVAQSVLLRDQEERK